MDERKDNSLKMTEEEYKKKIIDMIWQIKDKRFLKAIYISISEYLKEIEPV